MTNDHPTTTVVFAPDGTTGFTPGALQLQHEFSLGLRAIGRDTVCVVDAITFCYDNSANSEAALVQVDLLPYGSTIPIWRALVTVPAVEVVTIDKVFPEGLPLWTGYDTTVLAGDNRRVFGPARGPAALSSTSSTGAYAAAIEVQVDSNPWTGTAGGSDLLSVTYHHEPASNRRA